MSINNGISKLTDITETIPNLVTRHRFKHESPYRNSNKGVKGLDEFLMLSASLGNGFAESFSDSFVSELLRH